MSLVRCPGRVHNYSPYKLQYIIKRTYTSLDYHKKAMNIQNNTALLNSLFFSLLVIIYAIIPAYALFPCYLYT